MSVVRRVSVGAAVAWCALLTSCADGPGDRISIEEPVASPSSPTPTDGPPPPTSRTEKGVRVNVPSHCGVLSLTANGRLWLADPPLGDHNPPRGWDENQTAGVLLQKRPGRAIFKGDGGQRALFRRAPRGAEDPNAGCE